MDSPPRLSIITPSYNQAAYLEETIQSVLAQDYPNLEYIIVDGGSTDGSQAIIEKYADRLAWWVSERDHGQGEAINKGFARATGEIVAWINSDDYYLPGAFAAAVAALQAYPESGLVYSDVLAINGAGRPINVMRYGHWGLDELMQFHIIGQPGVFLRRGVLEQAGYLDLTYHYLLDHELWLRVAQQAPIRYFPQRWAAARYHPEAKNLSHPLDYGKDAYRLVEWMSTQPGLAARYQRSRRKIWAGAHCLNAHYLLDGGLAGPALKAYLRGLGNDPLSLWPVKRRVLYAAASLVLNLEWVKRRYLSRRQHNLEARLDQDGPSSRIR